ncbi:MAG: hypothetical protein AAGF54_12605 [Pseudomonadota bacterium]
MDASNELIFKRSTRKFVGMPLSLIWHGYGSAIFLEFGNLTQPKKLLKSGKPRNPCGEMGLMIEWSWRIEGKKTIFCGSWSENINWQRVNSVLIGQKIVELSVFGHLPEVEVKFENGTRFLSFMTERAHPMWSLFDRTGDKPSNIYSEHGRLKFG